MLSNWGPAQMRLARVSGQTGQILWDIALQEQPSPHQIGEPQSFTADDLDGDGYLDAAVTIQLQVQGNRPEFEFKVVSLRDGAMRWTRTIHDQGQFAEPPDIQVGRGAKNQSATVFLAETFATKTGSELVVRAPEGRDGTERWTWRSGFGEGDKRVSGGIDPISLDSEAKDAVCVTLSDQKRNCRVVLLDSKGRKRAERRLGPEPHPTDYFPPVLDVMFDLDGDGRDELLVWHDGVFSAWDRNLKAIWTRSEGWPVARYLPAGAGSPSELILSPLTAVLGTSGKSLWAYRSPTRWWVQGPSAGLLDRGSSKRMPLLISADFSSTACRYAIATTPEGITCSLPAL